MVSLVSVGRTVSLECKEDPENRVPQVNQATVAHPVLRDLLEEREALESPEGQETRDLKDHKDRPDRRVRRENQEALDHTD